VPSPSHGVSSLGERVTLLRGHSEVRRGNVSGIPLPAGCTETGAGSLPIPLLPGGAGVHPPPRGEGPLPPPSRVGFPFRGGRSASLPSGLRLGVGLPGSNTRQNAPSRPPGGTGSSRDFFSFVSQKRRVKGVGPPFGTWGPMIWGRVRAPYLNGERPHSSRANARFTRRPSGPNWFVTPTARQKHRSRESAGRNPCFCHTRYDFTCLGFDHNGTRGTGFAQ
jgi:hypothetical protein